VNAPAVQTHQLRCHHCSHGVGYADAPMVLTGMFKASRFGRVPQTHPSEVRKRCSGCGWVNVFHPSEPRASWRNMELKTQAG
jgi:hypothetical protein